jgi:crossover junction endodeoxyribonuclease RusA
VIVLPLPYPISANRYWGERIAGSGKKAFVQRYITPEARAYRQEVGWLAKAAGAHLIPGRVQVSIQLYPHRPLDFKKRMRDYGDLWDDTVQCLDLDNARKVLLDALNAVVFEDDKRIFKDDGERMEPDDRGARVVVTVRPYVRAKVEQIPLAIPVDLTGASPQVREKLLETVIVDEEQL